MIDLYQGDCLELLESISDNSIDAIICDLPYGTTRCSWDIALDLEKLWFQYLRVAKETAPIILFSSQPFTSKLICSNLPMYKYLWYWEKEKGSNFLRTSRQPLRVVEEISLFAKSNGYVYNAQMVPLDKPYRHTMPLRRSSIHGTNIVLGKQTAENREYKLYTHSHPKNLIKISRDNANKSVVPTQKPVALMEYLVRTYTNPGFSVLDNTMGSGTTGVACKRLGRRFIGMELSEKHFEIAKARIDQTTVEHEQFDLDDDLFVFPDQTKN